MLLLFFASIYGEAQTFTWSVLPSQHYTAIQPIGFNLFKVTDQNSKQGVISHDGQVIFETICDEITPFYRQWALLIKYDGKRRVVVGCLSVDGTCHRFNDTFYTLKGLEFYSEGFLPVENRKKAKVYIDYTGNECIGTKEKFYRITPFCEGMAVVFVNEKKSILIDRKGKPVSIIVSGVSGITLTHAFNAYQGVALVWDDDGNYFNYNLKNKTVSRTSRPSETVSYDYLYRPSDIGKIIPYDEAYVGNKDNMVSPIVIDGKYGYELIKDNKILLPCQFAEARSVVDGYAIVKMMDNECGILEYEFGDSMVFEITPVNKVIQYFDGETVACEFKVKIPDALNGQDINVLVKGVPDLLCTGGDIYAFSCKPGSSTQSFAVSIVSQGLELFQSNLDYSFIKKEKVPEQPKVKPENQKVSEERSNKQPGSDTKKQDNKKSDNKSKDKKKDEKDKDKKKDEKDKDKKKDKKPKRPDII